MAIGMGKMLGFEFPQNFNYPYISKSMTEFWRRWHMTLGSWFREYVYIPLGGNRVSKPRMYFNIFVVWAAYRILARSELEFCIVGFILFRFSSGRKNLFTETSRKKPRVFSYLRMLFPDSQLGTFCHHRLLSIGYLLAKVISLTSGNDWIYYLRNYFITFLLAIFCSVPLVEKLYHKVKRITVVNLLILAVILIVSVAYLVDATYNPFLYFRF